LAKKANWKTLAGLALAAATWRSIAEDLPIHDLITPPAERKPFVPVVGPAYKPPKPKCGFYEKAVLSYDRGLNVYSWRCVPDPTIPRRPGR